MGQPLHANNRGDFGDLVAEGAFDAHGQRHFAGRATHAGSVKSDLDDSICVHVDQFNVAAVTLDGWAKRFQDR